MTDKQLGPLADAYRKEVLKSFAEIENRRAKIAKLNQAYRQREADQHEVAQTEVKAFAV